MKHQLLFLGTGASMGVPVIGCQCAVCHSTSIFNQRLRPSVLLKIGQKQLLIDSGPDFRQQALRHQIHHLDGLILTHSHHDHTAGLDDLRAIYYKQEKPLPLLLSEETSQEITKRFDYLFVPNPYLPVNGPRLQMQLLPDTQGEILFEGIKITYVTYEQGGMHVNGFRLGELAYLSDVKHFDEAIFEALQGVKILIISALRFIQSPLHLSVDEAIDFANRVGAEKTWLTHISHELDHEKTNAYLPQHIQLAYDALTVDFGG